MYICAQIFFVISSIIMFTFLLFVFSSHLPSIVLHFFSGDTWAPAHNYTWNTNILNMWEKLGYCKHKSSWSFMSETMREVYFRSFPLHWYIPLNILLVFHCIGDTVFKTNSHWVIWFSCFVVLAYNCSTQGVRAGLLRLWYQPKIQSKVHVSTYWLRPWPNSKTIANKTWFMIQLL